MNSIKLEYISSTLNRDNSFIDALSRYFDTASIKMTFKQFAVGATKDTKPIFWLIDDKGICRDGKISDFNPDSAELVNCDYGVHGIGERLKKIGCLPYDWKSQPCLFGEHQLIFSDKPVNIVDDYTSAIVGTIIAPQYTWLATSVRLSSTDFSMLYPLKDKTVTVFPTQDTFDEWYKISDKCKYAKLKISDFVVENTELGESYADLIISNQSKDLISPLNYPEPVSVYSEDYDDYYCSVCTAFNWFASSHGLSIRMTLPETHKELTWKDGLFQCIAYKTLVNKLNLEIV